MQLWGISRLALAVVVGGALGCGGTGGSAGRDGGGDGGAPMDLSLLIYSDLSPQQLCGEACAALAACGMVNPSMAYCSMECQSGGAYQTCVRFANNDCNAIARCDFLEACGGLASTGTNSCKDTAACEDNCNLMTSGDATPCDCTCIAQMNPTYYFDILVTMECGSDFVKCPSCRPLPGVFDGGVCNACKAPCVAALPCAQH